MKMTVAVPRSTRNVRDTSARSPRTLKLLAAAAVSVTVAGVPAAPAAATHSGGPDNASCVAQFVTALPPGVRGHVISFGAENLQPFGRNVVSRQAAAPREDCLEFDTPPV